MCGSPLCSARPARKEAEMAKYLAGVLSVIAVGVLLIAYGLLNPRAAAGGYAPSGVYGYVPTAVPAGTVVQPMQSLDYAPAQSMYAQRLAVTAPAPRPVRTVSYAPDVQRRSASVRYVEPTPRRDWKRTALIIGGSSATGAGVGAIFGGKKGALIGAAIAGGASTIYQTVR